MSDYTLLLLLLLLQQLSFDLKWSVTGAYADQLTVWACRLYGRDA